MAATKTDRFSQVVRVIGAILLVPSFLGMGFAVLMFLSSVLGLGTMPRARNDAVLMMLLLTLSAIPVNTMASSHAIS